MAKKNLASLMSGIMGEEKPVMPSSPEPVKENINHIDSSTSGRPLNVNKSKIKNESPATFVVNNDMLRKLKYISLAEGVMIKTSLHQALTNFVENWERKNGEIHLPNKK